MHKAGRQRGSHILCEKKGMRYGSRSSRTKGNNCKPTFFLSAPVMHLISELSMLIGLGVKSNFWYRPNLKNAVLQIRDVYPGSRILIFTHPGSRIPDPKTAIKERGEKKFVVIPFYVATNFTKLKIILVLKCWRKKFGPIFKELYNFLPQNLSLSSQKYGFGIRDPRSWIRKKPIPDPGSWTRVQKGTGSRIRIRNTEKMVVKLQEIRTGRRYPFLFQTQKKGSMTIFKN
jgi:hypothetical protein